MEKSMNKVAQYLKGSDSLLGALEAIKNYRAYIAMLSGGLSAFLILSIFMFFSAKLGMSGNASMAAITGGIGGLASAVIFLMGLSATGILLMDQANGNEIRPIHKRIAS
jgi:hypothetical protein